MQDDGVGAKIKQINYITNILKKTNHKQRIHYKTL